ncbi:MAG: O-antigen ligase family protein [Ignavibacteriota bacterium]
MWQGSTVYGSVFQLHFMGGQVPGLWLHESFLFYTLILLLLERALSQDFYLARSYFNGPILLLGFALVVSWIHGMVILQGFNLVYEAHESILIVISFFIVVNIFRSPEERKLLMVLFVFAMMMKALDSLCVKFFSDDPGKGWGTVQMWRDGFLLGMGVSAAILFAHYRGKEFKWLRKLILWFSPILIYGLIVSFRRTFFLGLLASAIAMFFTLGKGRTKRQFALFGLLILGVLIFVLITDPIGIIARTVGGVVSPSEEGSSYIRLIEYPNILQNIYHHPFFGVPIGVQWYQYYRMPLVANFTTLGCHNTYLYWPLRTGMLGAFAFLWWMARIWKAVIINIRIQKTEEDFLLNQLMLHSMIVYNFASMFGLMYSDAMGILTAFVLVMIQLQIKHTSGLTSYKNVLFWETFKRKELVMRPGVTPNASRPNKEIAGAFN